MGNKIDTQGMSGDNTSTSSFTVPATTWDMVGPRDNDGTRPLYSDLERKQLKDIIIEALNEWSSNK